MTTLTITAKGQVTLRKDILRHLGLQPGQKIEIDLLPDGKATLRPARPTGRIEDFFGILAGKSDKKLTIEEMNDVIADSWAGKYASDD